MNTQIYKLTRPVPRVTSLKHDVSEGQDLSFSLFILHDCPQLYPDTHTGNVSAALSPTLIVI